jgi:c(7)-type cytochrome triheme protein
MRPKHIFYPLLALALFLMFLSSYAETQGVKKKRLRPNEFGNVVIDNHSSLTNTVAPVVFKHWLHRSRYTCRLCHIDIGFAMYREETGITCDDVENGFYCGTCHDGKEAFGRVKASLTGKRTKNCKRCHSYGEAVEFKHKFYEFRRKLPKERLGNGINWQKAEEANLIKLKDFIKDISVKRKKRLKDPRELEVSLGETVMPDIIFSHKKHAVWSGCELCHPELFGVKEGDTVYSMKEIFDGKYCGVCHGIVAFPNNDCQRCHTKEVY